MCVRVRPMFARMLRGLWISALGALAAGATGCAAESNDTASGDADYTNKGKIQLLVTVDWEGRDLRDDNLQAMKDLHARFPQVKVVNFLNAAYFTKEGADAEGTKAKIESALGANDERGLHIHGWKSLFEAAGVTFINGPSFWGTPLTPDQCLYDCGHEVPISLYSTEDLRKVVRFSLDKLEAEGFGRAKSFRCGGWMAKDNVREAVAAEGLRYEESAVPTDFLRPKLSSYPVQGWLDELWAGTTQTTQPYEMSTAAGSLVEVPDNGALADYVSPDQMFGTYAANKAAWQANPASTQVVSIGFHEETASMYLPQLEKALARIYDDAEANRVPLESVTTDAIAVRH